MTGASDTSSQHLDRAAHAALGRVTRGLSPAALTTAYLDWAMHLIGSPEKQAELWARAAGEAAEAWGRWLASAAGDDGEAVDLAADKRFRDPAWGGFPFNLLGQWFLAQQAWWEAATTGLHGVDPRHERMVSFAARQILDAASPSNFALTNPVVLSRTREEMGRNLMRGFENYLEDFNHLLSGEPRSDPAFKVGETLAITPGQVIFRNRLIEVIRYAPTTGTVCPEPILIVPAWIMKYYILDLSPKNSMVRYLLDQGFEVYMISWKNPDAGDADLSLQDYVDLGVMAALDAVTTGREGTKVHAVGYCLGGTLLSIAAAAMARDGDTRLHTISLLAAQVDFVEAGELTLFINESQVAFLEDIMAEQGFLRADQMAGAFRMLRSNDLIWSRVVRHYLLGERTPMNDLMAWNADATRMPARMHTEYLRWLFLENRLARGQFLVRGQPVALTDITAPIFCVGTETDHVSPWRSVYKIGLLTDTDVTFVLTRGGHNAGIISEPGHPRRHYRHGHKTEGERFVSAEAWADTAERVEGSWWPEWADWLTARSGAKVRARKKRTPALGPAPGTYVYG